MRRRLPSTTMMVAFESASRWLSFTKAARELHVTQSAVSHQVIAMEELLGIDLFTREEQRLELTTEGRRLAERLRPLLAELEAAVESARVSLPLPETSLSLAVLPTFATRWLIPRMNRFNEQHPDVTVSLAMRIAPFAFDGSSLDAAIHYGPRQWIDSAELTYIMDEELVVVCNLDLAPQLCKLSDLVRFPLLHLSTRPRAWEQWARSVGLSGLNPNRGFHFESFDMVTRAAIAGLGVAILPRFFGNEELASNQLSTPLEGMHPPVGSEFSYYFVNPLESSGSRPVAALRSFILREAQREEVCGPLRKISNLRSNVV